MSLLMEALKKAEMAKRLAANAAAGEGSLPDLNAPDALSMEPMPVRTVAKAPELASTPEQFTEKPVEPVARTYTREEKPRLDELPGFHNISLDEPVMAPRPLAAAAPAATAVPPVTAAPLTPATQTLTVPESTVKERQNVANVFQAKQAHAQAAAGKRSFAIAIGATIFLALIAIGIYFWWELQPKSGLVPPLSAARPIAPPVSSAPPVSTAAPVTATNPAPPASTAAPGTEAGSATTPLANADGATPGPATQPAQTSTPNAAAGDSDDAPAPAPKLKPTAPTLAKAPTDEDRLLRPTRSPLRVSPALSRAFAAMNRGDFAGAQQAYTQALAADPQNSDALHGLANLATKQGKLADAENYFQRLLLADPQDTAALAGLTHLQSRQNSAQAENRLTALASAKPEEVGAQIALGNLYASQSRWAESQQAYFAAYALQPENPDVLYNLAVTLEHLNQPALAIQYYREALQASKHRPAGFVPAHVEERLRALVP
ncbi:MAG: tetratricopeptide repeat protein [Rhodocyclaceae bacterium]|nr:tetratricopeptide repeat protein [Rhodocyclaceae bacterium]